MFSVWTTIYYACVQSLSTRWWGMVFAKGRILYVGKSTGREASFDCWHLYIWPSLLWPQVPEPQRFGCWNLQEPCVMVNWVVWKGATFLLASIYFHSLQLAFKDLADRQWFNGNKKHWQACKMLAWIAGSSFSLELPWLAILHLRNPPSV